ncbi:cupredoxin domain-containing protein [Candidatus Peregrinibacteria bacterium]|nr:cupredoxin domain-containing protein [Candidatus Peregrinibacteria bacterium]
MDIKTKIQIIVSLGLVTLIGLLTWWIQLPPDDLKAQLLTEEQTVLVRIKEFEYTPDIVRIEKDTVVSWLNDESGANAGIQHTVTSGDLFQSDFLSQGDTFSYKFTEEGVYNYSCSLHPFMTGKVCVGAASEDADPDCVIDATQPQETLGGDEDILTPPTEEITEEEDSFPLIEEIGEETDDSFAFSPTEELSGAADEDFVPTSTTTTSTTTTQTYAADTAATQYADTDLSKSGPEDLIYVLLALIAMFAARALNKAKI